VKVLVALVFLFFPFSALAGSHTVLAIPPYELDDWFEGSTEQNAFPVQMTNFDENIEEEAVATVQPADEEDITGRNNAPQGLSENTQTVLLKQETRPAQAFPAQPALNWLGEVIDEGREDASAGVQELDEAPVGAIDSNNERWSASKDREVPQDTIEQSSVQMLSAQPDKLTAPADDAGASVVAAGVAGDETEALDVFGLE